jgi:hypothetical protein
MSGAVPLGHDEGKGRNAFRMTRNGIDSWDIGMNDRWLNSGWNGEKMLLAFFDFHPTIEN